MTIHDIAWAAGFFEGEGNTGFNFCYNKSVNKSYPRLALSIAQVHREPLDAFQKVFGIGTVRGPYGPYNTTKQPYFQYQTSGRKAIEVLEQMKPYLFEKAIQAEGAIKKYKEHFNV